MFDTIAFLGSKINKNIIVPENIKMYSIYPVVPNQVLDKQNTTVFCSCKK
jgi:hypothetical protein